MFSAYEEQRSQLARKNSDDCKKEIEKDFKKIVVLFRIIQKKIDKNKNSSEINEFETNVIRYNNSQNSIQHRDFYANAKEQIGLQRIFSKLGYFYEIKRGDREYITNKDNKHNLLNKKLDNFKYKDKNINIQKFAGIWMAYYAQQPSSKIVTEASIFGSDKNYDLLFKDEEFSEKIVKEMILAFNIFSIIEKESRENKSILKHISEDTLQNNYDKAKKTISNSLIFNNITKKNFNNLFNLERDEKDVTIERIKKFHPFNSGKHIVTALVKHILDKCKYLNTFLESELYADEEWIKKNVIANWLPIILNRVFIPHYEEVYAKKPSINYYYTNPKNYEKLTKKISDIPLDDDKEYKEIFVLGEK